MFPPDFRPSLIDPSRLHDFFLDVCVGDPELFAELRRDCRRDIESQLGTLEESLGSEDFVTFSRAAHSLKSTARTFGSPAFAEACFSLERASDPSRSSPSASALRKDLENLRRKSELFLRELGTATPAAE